MLQHIERRTHMYSLMHTLRTRLTVVEGAALLIAMVFAELFYKFHSFTLECAAFLVTWYAVGRLLALFGLLRPDAAAPTLDRER
jgi:hypothetical protein